jgi:hypothetical protein
MTPNETVTLADRGYMSKNNDLVYQTKCGVKFVLHSLTPLLRTLHVKKILLILGFMGLWGQGTIALGYDKSVEDSVPLSKTEEARYGWRAFGPDVADSGKAGEGEIWVNARWRLGTYGVGNAFLGPLNFSKYPKLVFEARSSANTANIWVYLNRLVVEKATGTEKIGTSSITQEGEQAQVQGIASSIHRKTEQMTVEWQEFTFKFPEDFDLLTDASLSDAAQVDELTIVVGNPGTENQETISVRNVRLVK